MFFYFFICVRRIFFLILKLSFFIHFFPLSFRRKKKEKEPKKEERNGCEHSNKNARITWLAFLRMQKDASAIISTKMLLKHSHFRDALFVLRLV